MGCGFSSRRRRVIPTAYRPSDLAVNPSVRIIVVDERPSSPMLIRINHQKRIRRNNTPPRLPSPSCSQICTICLEELGSSKTRLPCGHVYHRDCIVKWLRRSHTCPLRCPVEREWVRTQFGQPVRGLRITTTDTRLNHIRYSRPQITTRPPTPHPQFNR